MFFHFGNHSLQPHVERNAQDLRIDVWFRVTLPKRVRGGFVEIGRLFTTVTRPLHDAWRRGPGLFLLARNIGYGFVGHSSLLLCIATWRLARHPSTSSRTQASSSKADATGHMAAGSRRDSVGHGQSPQFALSLGCPAVAVCHGTSPH